MPICLKCQTYFPVWKMIDGKLRNLSNRKFCVVCSPFGQRNTKNLTKSPLGVPVYCNDCGILLDSTNCYIKPKSKTFQNRCKICFNRNSHERQRETKRLCVEYKGGCCSICGYKKCLQALEFHHHGSEQKEREISAMKSRSFQRLKSELDEPLT